MLNNKFSNNIKLIKRNFVISFLSICVFLLLFKIGIAQEISPYVKIRGYPDGLESQELSIRVVTWSGTIIQHNKEKYILSCAHTYRNYKEDIPLRVELFSYPNLNSVTIISSKLIRKNLDIDTAIFTYEYNGETIYSTLGKSIKIGDKIHTYGCDNGSDPFLINLTIQDIYSDYVFASEHSVTGRSGSGIFNENFELIGITSSTDTKFDRGYYVKIYDILEFMNSKK